ncbi:hypothetical protein FB470_007068 [Amycolatopsis thermophila]|uniref:Uncharacterized protein n=1 Tax=Amycolatopsis thermophila TaxID=206084 RepID=A0ABU0F653_9PSEU|nr:hypothetical protein [Amycolatopsis thermophila]
MSVVPRYRAGLTTGQAVALPVRRPPLTTTDPAARP